MSLACSFPNHLARQISACEGRTNSTELDSGAGAHPLRWRYSLHFFAASVGDYFVDNTVRGLKDGQPRL